MCVSVDTFWEGSCDALYGMLMRSWGLRRASSPLWWTWWCSHWWECILERKILTFECTGLVELLIFVHLLFAILFRVNVIRILISLIAAIQEVVVVFFFLKKNSFWEIFLIYIISAHREMLSQSWRKTQTLWRMSLMKRKCSFLRLLAGGDASWTGRSKTLETAKLFQVSVSSLS